MTDYYFQFWTLKTLLIFVFIPNFPLFSFISLFFSSVFSLYCTFLPYQKFYVAIFPFGILKRLWSLDMLINSYFLFFLKLRKFPLFLVCWDLYHESVLDFDQMLFMHLLIWPWFFSFGLLMKWITLIGFCLYVLWVQYSYLLYNFKISFFFFNIFFLERGWKKLMTYFRDLLFY